MALQKPNSRRLLNKDEEEELKASDKFFLPTLEELTAIEEKAKEDAAAAVSSQMADPMRNRNDLGRVAMQSAKQEMLAEHESAVNEQKQKVERAKQEYEAYPLIDRIGLGSSSLMADIARDNIKKQENEYDRMTMTEPEYAKKHKADFGESVEQIVQSAGYGAAKSFGQAADVISATGAGLKSAGKWLGGEGDDKSSAAKEFARGFQNRLADTEKSLYDEIDAEYQRERRENAKVNGELNVFAGYVDQAAHSVGEQALMYWTASMSSALFGGAKAFTAISSKADDLAKSGKKGMQMLGQALGKINAGSVGGAASMLITSSAQSTKEAILDMRQQNKESAAYGMPKKYTDDEIMEKSALYGFLNGISEVGLEYAIGGVTGAAGSIMPKGKVTNPFLIAVLSYLKGGAGEGFEESVQTLASTGLKRAVYDQAAEVDWREVLDSGIVGMLTGFGMGAPSFIRNTSVGVSAMRDVSNTAKATNRVNTDAQAGVVASVSAAKAKAYGQMAEQVKNTDSENADTIASIYAWAAGRQQEIADAMADDTKRKQIIEENAKKSAEDTQAAIQRMRDTNSDFAETERTGLASGANEEDIRMAGELSSVLGKKIRFFREDAKNGTINNGEYHEDTGEIWINTRSKNVKAQIVAHELTHSIEKKDGYQKLVNLAMDKLEAEQKAKGKTLDDLYREKETLYADGGVRLASYDEITSELVAEYVEKRLLTDEASIKSLVSENRTLGQRIREWFDSLLAKMGNASAKEREYIRQMRDVYARALGEDVIETGDNVIKHDISVTEDGKMYVTASRKVITGKNTDEKREQITNFFKELLQDKRSLDIQTVEGDVLTLTMSETANKARDKAKQVDGVRVELSDAQFGVKLNAEAHVDELAEISKGIGNSTDKKNHPFAKDGFTYRRAYFEDFDGKYYEITLSVGHNGTTATVYNVTQKESTPPTAKVIAVVGSRPRGMLSKNSISQNGGNVNSKFSVSRVTQDSDGRQLSEGQQEYFRDSKVTDANGNLKVMYHGTTGEGFTVFDKRKAKSSGTFGNGFYFSDSKSHAGQYGKTYEVYLNITNPLTGGTKTITRNQMRDFVETVAENEDYGIENYGYGATVDSVARSLSSKSDFEALMDINITCIGNMAEALQLFGEVTGKKYDGIITPMETVVFDPEQIKNVDNLNPTSDPDIRYSVSREDTSATEAETDQTLQQIRNDIAADEARYRELSDTVMSNERFNALMPDEQNAILDEMQSLRKRIDDANPMVQDMSYEGDAGEDVPVTGDEDVPADRASAEKQDDVSVDATRYKEISDIIKDEAKFGSMTPEERNAIFDEMNEILARNVNAKADGADRDIKTVYERNEQQKQNAEKELASIRLQQQKEIESRQKKIDDLQKRYDSKKNKDTKEAGRLFRQIEREKRLMADMEADYAKRISDLKGRIGKREAYMEHYLEIGKPETPDERLAARQKKRKERKTVAKAETAFKRLGYDIDGAIVDNYEDAAGIIEDNSLAAQVESDINKYIKDNQVQFYVDNTAKLLARGDMKLENVALKGEDLKHAKLLADMYRQFVDISGNSIREQGKKNTNIVNDRLDQILGGYDWYSAPNKSRKFWRQQLQLSLSNPEQVIRDVFGEGAVADELNDYIIRPTIENSARARRQTNQMVSGLRDLGLSEAESAVTQIFSEYSNLEESGSKKAVLSESSLRELLADSGDADANTKIISDIAEQIAATEYGDKESKEKKDFRDSIIEQFQNEMNVNQSRARQRAIRDYKEQGGTAVSWNALPEDAKKAKIDAAYETVTDESIERIVNGTKELRKLLDDMYEAINQISVIHGADPIKFRKGYMPHSHKQTEELQKWFNDHMGGLNVTPVQDLPTDIAGKTADRKPNKRWFSHAQERTGPRTTWDALGNIEDYLRIANDTIYHMDDIRKMRVLERYIRGIYSVARGATGEEQRTRVRNDVMQRMHGTDDDLVFLGLKKPEQKQVSDEDMDLSQMTTFVTWLTNYTNDLAAKQIFNRDIESFAGRKVNNLANTLTSWSSRTMMQYNISSNLKQLSQFGTVSGDVGARISKDAAAMTLRSMQNLGNGTNELEQKYHISERSTFLAEKEAIEEATFASDKDLTEKQKTDRQHTKDVWDYAWSFTDTTMSRYAVYAYFMEGMNRGMDDTAALHYADTKARNILASRMKGSSPLIFQSKNPILRMFTLFQREPLAAWQDILKTMPREYNETKISTDEKTAKEQITKRIAGRLLGAGIVNTVYATVLGLGTPAMFDIFGEPLRALLDKLWREITPDEEDDITFKEMAERYISTLGDEIADDIPFANVVSLISNTYAGTEFESRLALNAPDLRKIFGIFGLGGKAAWNGAQLLWSDDAEDIELLEELSTIPGQIPVTILDMITEIVGTAAPAGNQIRKSAKGLIAVLRSGEYTKDGKLKYEVGGVGDSIRAVLLGSSNTRAGQEWIASGFDSLSKTETEAYKALIGAGVSEKRARQYVERVAEVEKVADETQAQAEARMIDGMRDLTKAQKAELYYDMVATDNQRAAVDAAVGAGAKIDDAVETARAIRDSSKKLDRLTALQASDMDTDAREEMYLAMVATKVKDADGNVIGTEDDDTLEALYTTGLDFDDFLDAKQMQSVLNANESLTANQRASRFLAWTASQGYTQAQADAIGENFGFSSGFRVKSETYQKIVDSGVTAENAVKVTDAIAGKTKTAEKINAVWSTGLSGNQLDLAVKSVLSEKAYERYRIVVDANIPLEIYTWALLNADQDAEGEKGHGSVNNTERELILSQLALPRKDLSALWLALGGSEKSNPYSGGTSGVSVPKVTVPKVEIPKIELPTIDFNIQF